MPSFTDTDSNLTFPILIGDIGGTNARFGLVLDAFAEPKMFPIIPTTRYASIEEALQTSILDKTSVQPRSAIIAVAGPVKGDDIPLTNAGWVIKPKDMLKALSLEDVIIINDFEAQALAIASIGEDGREQIGPGSILESASCAVLGPGTGLGVAGLVHAQHAWIPVPGEGGHVDVGPRSERDCQIWPFLEPIEGRISAEQLLCGRGIMNIYRAVCESNVQDPHLADPAAVTTAALAGSDEAAVETVSLFSTYLGRVAGDMAMIFMARGGVFLAGGISQKILPALKKPEFRQAFEDKAPHSALLRTIPTFVVTHPTAALSGLAAYARTPSRFGVATEGRRWRT
ncbi:MULTISPECIES: glucokinase [unclassified Rhizobium]|uniref:glucokinase n=1 Tax=unclassified Rhizobium TaxID=2613769 RepID=UPI0007151C74|nr:MULTISPECIES: glucokinase [unclassified Rhizobium]KQS87961.1 glucokinase [Rhizobium sp. Leaf386]KQS94482.1 glucokinase [Rhizobium sp. Leaf391]KQU01488.1 glucokinase [Rhizobium sp. Leaf453]